MKYNKIYIIYIQNILFKNKLFGGYIMSKVEHGANLFELASKYGFNIDEIMDFSSNINPFGASPKALS